MSSQETTVGAPPAGTAAKVVLAARAALGERGTAVAWEAKSRLLYAARYRRSRERLARLRDSHAGERCFIIGNGPSLKQTNLPLLEREYTFGLNRIYLGFEDFGFSTSSLVCINTHVLEQSGHELAAIPGPKFLNVESADRLPSGADITFLRPTNRYEFSTDLGRGVWEGATVTFVAMQLAYWMGFRKVVLVGVDHNFSAKGPARELVTSDGPDADHFTPGYFGAGYRWQLPDLEASEYAYAAARDAFASDGREILDATVGGKLAIYPKVALESLF